MKDQSENISFQELLAQNNELKFKNERLEKENTTLKKMIFGSKSERFVPIQNANQLSFIANQSDPAEQPAVKTQHISGYDRGSKPRRKKPASRQPLPAHLPRHDIIIEPDQDITGMKKIGDEITEELEYEPPKYYVNRYIRPKYALPKDEGVVIGHLPSRPIEKGIAGPGVIAHLLISKYIDHLPYYRQLQQFKRFGLELAESTVCDWGKAGSDLVQPLVDLLKKQVLSASYLMADETPIKVLDPAKKGTTHQGYYWVYYDPLGKQVFFDYQKSRSREGPNTILKQFKGYLQTDGYKAYNEIGARAPVTPLGCMAHARRHFIEAQDSNPDKVAEMLFMIQKLYAIERYARENKLTFEQRLCERQKAAAPVFKEMKAWLERESMDAVPKSNLAKAITYIQNSWDKFQVYLTDGRLEIDNNLVENAIRPIALGRKNYLFAGSHKGAKRAAAIYTLVSNAKLADVEPFSYLRDVLRRISDHPHNQLESLLPKNWKQL
jgi:transposase